MRELKLNLGTFTRPVVLDVARRDGALAAAGIVVHETPVTSSPAQFTSLDAGQYDLVFTSPDNIIAYRLVHDNPLGRLLPVEIIAAIDRGLGLSLCLAPDVATLEQARGHDLGVDVPTSGFAFVAYELLARAGLMPGDYSLATLGATPRRAEALAEGSCAVTILNAGNELRALAQGCHVHSTVADLGPYLGTVIARLATEDPTREDDHRRFVDVMQQTVENILTGQREEAVIESAMELLGLDESEAKRHYEILLDPAHGYIGAPRDERAALATLLELRRRYLPSADLDGAEERFSDFIAGELLGSGRRR